MRFILHRYVLREVIWPTGLSLVALTFIIFFTIKVPGTGENLLLMLMRIFFRDEIPKSDVLALTLLFLPTPVLFILPMALLIGIFIGIGRMTIDLEIRAIQTSGIHPYVIFMPVILLSLCASAFIFTVGVSLQPRMVAETISRIGRVLTLEFSNLQPGRVYAEVFGSQSGINLHFDERDSETQRMIGITVLLDKSSFESEADRDAREGKRDAEENRLEALYEQGRISLEELERLEYDLKIREQSDAPIMIFAREAELEANAEEARVDLRLFDGSIHILDTRPAGQVTPPSVRRRSEGAIILDSSDALGPVLPDISEILTPANGAGPGEGAGEGALEAGQETRDYTLITFGKFSKRETIGGSEKQTRRSKTMKQLRIAMADQSIKSKPRARAKAAYIERISVAFQSFALAFIGLPLAVWVRPSGKSVGVIVAFILIMIYHWLLRTGFTMVESGGSAGAFVMFLPNILFVSGGFLLWGKALRS